MKQFIPVIISNIISGLFLLIVLYIAFINYKSILGMDLYKRIMVLLLISIAISVHGLTHVGLNYV